MCIVDMCFAPNYRPELGACHDDELNAVTSMMAGIRVGGG